MLALPDICYNHVNQMRGKTTGSSNSVSTDIRKEQKCNSGTAACLFLLIIT